MSEEHKQRKLKQTQVVIEATRYEQLSLWKEFHKEKNYSWVEETMGYGINVGYVDDMPVCVSVFWAQINGKCVMFIHPTSMVVDYRLIEQWVFDTCNIAKIGDAMNFYNHIS